MGETERRERVGSSYSDLIHLTSLERQKTVNADGRHGKAKKTIDSNGETAMQTAMQGRHGCRSLSALHLFYSTLGLE